MCVEQIFLKKCQGEAIYESMSTVQMKLNVTAADQKQQNKV